MNHPLYGLVMAGGMSRRMGRDKALLDYHGEPQALRTHRFLLTCCEQVFISCRGEQLLGEKDRGSLPRIHDEVPGLGPLGGILSAHTTHPGVAWLVVACDLPRLDADGLQHLVAQRDASAWATAYLSVDELPEPLCAIYEPSFMSVLRAALDADKRCPRRIMLDHADRVKCVELPHPFLLDNANTPEEAARHRADPRDATRDVTLNYFAIFREQAGCTHETRKTTASTLSALYEEVRVAHGFTLSHEWVRVAVDDSYVPLDSPLLSGMVVTCVPPVSGG